MQNQNQSLQTQVTQVCNMAMAMGLHKNIYDGQTKLLTHMPVSYYPYEVSEETYLKLKLAHTIWVKLLLKVSKDREFVNRVFEKTARSDQFVKRYLDMYNKFVDKETYGVTCIRVDYMGDQKPQLVEYNLMSVGLNGMSDGVQRLASLRQQHRVQNHQVYYPQNQNQVTLLNAIQSTVTAEKLTGIVLMVVHEKHQKEFNFGDQNCFELEALRRKLKVKRVSMSQFIGSYRVDEKNQLYLSQEKVAVVYFRTAYSPAHYPTEQHWVMRQDIQKANVLSIPSVSMQLVNFKRMQVEFSNIDILKKYLPQNQAQLIHSLLGEQYVFQDPKQLPKLQSLVHSNNYVLKSNREGGGNNYFGQQAAKKIDEYMTQQEELEKYILQNKIKSDIRDNIFVANYRYLEVKECTCEYSTFGSYAYKGDELRYNVCGGNLIRLKRAEENQGGIAIDKAVIAGLCVVKKEQK